MPSKKWVTEVQIAATFCVSAGGHTVGTCTGILLEEVEENRAPHDEPLRERRRWRILDVRGPSMRQAMEPQRDELFEIELADGRRGSAMVRGSTITGNGPLT